MRHATTPRAVARILPGSRSRRALHSAKTVPVSPIRSVLIANRGEIALRVGRTAATAGIRCTTIYTEPDTHSQHALSSAFTVNLGVTSAYLDGEKIIAAAKHDGCQALHPGYGFLSENSAFAKRCGEEGLIFIGPPWEAIEAMGNKSRSKDIMIKAGVPCVPGYHGDNQDPKHLLEEARKIGFPVLVKAVKGGGGKGMRIVNTEQDFLEKLESAKSEGRNSFGDDVMLVEKYITTPRHIEVQVFADKHGNAVALGERDCSLQRRHQKILEEAPAPNLDEKIRRDLWQKGTAAALAVGYEGAGTVEFIFDNDTNEFFFMEMNTRLQVEHPVTEAITGEDLVAWQFKIAAGETLPLDQETIEQRIRERGWALEARIYAENPEKNFMPDSGKLLHLRTPQILDGVRIDAGFVQGDTVSSNYDGMIAKLIVSGSSRKLAIQKMRTALEEYEVVGINTNIDFLKRICQSPAFIEGDVETGYIQKHHNELFSPARTEPEVYAQAALGLYLQELEARIGSSNVSPHGHPLGFPSTRSRVFRFLSSAQPPAPTSTVEVTITTLSPGLFSVTINSSDMDTITYEPVSSNLVNQKSITTYFPHTRISSTLVTRHSLGSETLTIFQRGTRTQLTLPPPEWHAAALGTTVVTNSVLAPMPCKILGHEVRVGDVVIVGQALVVIESMKMETVITSPVAGVVRRLSHAVGEICKAGTVLVEFEEGEGEEGGGLIS